MYSYETMVVPGLLQTAEYMEALFTGSAEENTREHVQRLMDLRLSRQSILHTPESPALSVLVDETVLQRPIGGSAVMVRQLQHLADLTERPHISIRVVPMSSGAHTGLNGPFLIFDFPSAPSLVYVEQRVSCALFEEPHQVAMCRRAFRSLQSLALPRAASTDFLYGLCRNA
jgi:hypothetical protein